MEIVTMFHQKNMLSPTDMSDVYRSMKRTVWLLRIFRRKDGRIRKKEGPDVIYSGGVCLHRSGIILSVNSIFPDEDFEVYGNGENTKSFRMEFLGRDSLHNLSLLAVKPVCGDTVLEFDFSVFSQNEAFIGQNVFSIIHIETLFYSLACGHVAYPHMRTYSDVKPDIEMRCMKNSCDPPFSSKKDSQPLGLVQIYGFPTLDDICGCPVFEATGRLIGLIGFIGQDFSYAISLADLKEFCMEKRQLGFPQNITISFEGDRIVEVKTQKGVSGKKRKNERSGGSSKQTRSEKFIKKKSKSEKLLKQKHHFFKHARSTLACTFPNGLFPLVDHFKMQKTKEADLLVEHEALYQDKEPLSQHIRRISTWNFSQEDLKSQAALIQDDNGVTDADDQDVSWEQCDQHDEVRLPAERSLRSNNSIRKPSQEDELIDLHDLEGLLASFPIETLHALKGCFDIGEDDEGTVSPKWKGAQSDSEQQLLAQASGAINQDTGKYESENSRQSCSIQCQVIPEQEFLGSAFSSKKGTSDGESCHVQNKRLRVLLTQSVNDVLKEVDVILDPVPSMCQLKSQIQSGKSSKNNAAASNGDAGQVNPEKLKIPPSSSSTGIPANSSSINSGSSMECMEDNQD